MVDVVSPLKLAMRETGLKQPRKANKSLFLSLAAKSMETKRPIRLSGCPPFPATTATLNPVVISAIDLSNALHIPPHWAYSFSIETHLVNLSRLAIEVQLRLPVRYG